ncbi:hypothetical protein [Paracoccus litorisediminis]|uniref:Uncharacterized protein n=1 Tax=Paracoccus litorisediminis TaxID=2006130 RepID=A0A844HX93_9RHOB|nr:hypothetical protein [Paracoccus litorisediminis]MTH62121.1 hypothetical protein [Paracoccus litorisediminis]
MGGVLRVNRATKIFRGGDRGDIAPEKIFRDGEMVWSKPYASTLPAKIARTSDVVLCVGSSDMACLTGNTWSPGLNHTWPTVFRDNYDGPLATTVAGYATPGIQMAATLGRVTLDQVITNAHGGQYGSANPFTHMADHDVLILDTSDLQIDSRAAYPGAEHKYSYTNMPAPYAWSFSPFQQDWHNAELRGRMELMREAAVSGIRQVWLAAPWPRLDSLSVVLTPEQMENWFQEKFDSLGESMEWQQDRLNYQVEQEGSPFIVSMIPFHLLFKRLYEDIRDGIAPILTDYRQVHANGDNTNTGVPVTSITVPKHWYMLNYRGDYLINCLVSYLVFGIDPRGKPATDGVYTLEPALATYFQNIAYEIGSTYPRAGRVQGTPQELTYRMPRIRNSTPAQILGSDLLFHRATPTVTGASYSFPSGPARYVTAVFDIDVDAAASGFADLFHLLGSGSDKVALSGTYNSEFDALHLRSYIASLLGEGAVQPSGMGTSSGVRRYLYEGFHPYPGHVGLSGRNAEIYINRFELNQVGATEGKQVAGQNQASVTPNPTVNRLVVPHAAVTVHNLIASRVVPTGGQRFNLQRYLQRAFQMPYGIEDLWPDLVE